MSKPKALFILHKPACATIYGLGARERLEEILDVLAPPMQTEEALLHPELLAETEVILSGWGAPQLTAEVLALMPRLKVVFYGAGSIRALMTTEAWDRGIRVTSSYAANAIPVADFTLAQIILCLKSAYAYARAVKELRHYPERNSIPLAGTYRSTIGLVSMGMIGRMVVQRLSMLDVNIVAYDPFVSAEEAAELGVEMVSLEEVFQRADVVSLHTPWLKETERMVNGKLLRSMKHGAAFINTSRGAVVHEAEMIEVLQQRPDIQVVLDVTYPEPPVKGSPFYTLPNVVLTPHIAGSMRLECARMGASVLADVEHYLAGKPLQWEISRERAAIMA